MLDGADATGVSVGRRGVAAAAAAGVVVVVAPQPAAASAATPIATASQVLARPECLLHLRRILSLLLLTTVCVNQRVWARPSPAPA